MASTLKIIGQEPTGSPNSLVQLGGVAARHFFGRAAVVTLGCAKNQVDSEVMLGTLAQSGFELVKDVNIADVAIVNTCGFLESAVKESIDTIIDLGQLKQSGRLRKLIVAGCMVERYGPELADTLPEVDAFITTDDLKRVGEVAGTSSTGSLFRAAGRPYFLYDETTPRILSTQSHSVYVKISEGCVRPCTFCIIPTIRGPIRSRTIDSVVNEIKDLSHGGVKEVNLVAQDLTAFGLDRKERGLSDLLRAIDRETGITWVRLLYAYPVGVDQRLLETIVGLPSVCNYLDIPLQHSSESILKEMKRPLGKYSPRKIVEFIKNVTPEVKLRTTFIVGFPGETEADIDDLAAFISEGHFASVGVFAYSNERGTPAHELAGHLPESIKEERRARLMDAQKDIVERDLSRIVGQRLEVMIDGTHQETDLLLTARTRFQAPEVDGVVIINDSELEGADIFPGKICQVEVTEVAGYDLVARIVNDHASN